MNNNRYDEEKTAKAQKALLLRLVVAGYLVFLGVKIFRADNTTMSTMLSHIIGIFFIASALAFGAFSLLRMQNDISAAKLTDNDNSMDGDRL